MTTKADVLTAIDNLKDEAEELKWMMIKVVTDQVDSVNYVTPQVPVLSDLVDKIDAVITKTVTLKQEYGSWKTDSSFYSSYNESDQIKLKVKSMRVFSKFEAFDDNIDQLLGFIQTLEASEIPNDKFSDLSPTLQRIGEKAAWPTIEGLTQGLDKLQILRNRIERLIK